MAELDERRVPSMTEHVRLEARIDRLEEKHTDTVVAIEKLTAKVDDLGLAIRRASWVIVGGGSATYFLMSGQLAQLLGIATVVQ